MRSNNVLGGADLARAPAPCQEKANLSRALLSLNPETAGLVEIVDFTGTVFASEILRCLVHSAMVF